MNQKQTKKRSSIKKWLVFITLFALVLLMIPAAIEPKQLVDSPSQGASIKIYGANVWGFRGYFAVHTWVATRQTTENQYQIHQVIGWRLRRTGSALVASTGVPNTPWFGNKAMLLHELSGDEATRLIPKVRQAIQAYPYKNEYSMVPGPNSNSFTEWVGLSVPELELQLPTKAIGRLWMRLNFDSAKKLVPHE